MDDAGEPEAAVDRRTNVRRFVLLLLALTLAACSHSSGRARGTSTSTIAAAIPSHLPTRTVTSRLEVASLTIKAGSAVRVVIVIENNTGTAIRQPACHTSTMWQAYLTNGHDASGPLPTTYDGTVCDPTKRVSVPTGESRLVYTTHATYFGCANAPDSYPPTPRCIGSGDKMRMPSLPAGRYRIAVNESPYVGVPKPAALAAVIVR